MAREFGDMMRMINDEYIIKIEIIFNLLGMHSKEVTPKAVAALQKLLSCNTNHKQNLQMSTRLEVQG